MGLFKDMKNMQGQAAQQMAGAGDIMQQYGGGDMQAQAAYAQLAQKLHAQGIEAPGVVHSVTPSGEVDFGGGVWTDFVVSIRPASGEPFQTTVRQSMLPAQLEGIAEGSAITVKYDPDSPTSAMIFGW